MVHGVRISLFVSGCPHHCKGCFNEVTWDFTYGKPYTQETINHILELLKPDYIKGITFLGGEPMAPSNQEAVLNTMRQIKEHYTNKDIWLYTGYLLDTDIMGKMVDTLPHTREILSYIDVLVDGPIHRRAEKPESAIQGFGKPADNRYEKDAFQRKHCALERRLKNAPAARYVHS